MSQHCYCNGMKDGFALSWQLNRLYRTIFNIKQMLTKDHISENNRLYMLELKLEKISIYADPFACCESYPSECKKKFEHLFGLFKSVKKKVDELKVEIEIALIVNSTC